MGRLAEALRANLKSVAESDARALREIDQELKSLMKSDADVVCDVKKGTLYLNEN